jgi:cytochrome oxidase Cu insertion factor (SCO1/SenC/PrrC family)
MGTTDQDSDRDSDSARATRSRRPLRVLLAVGLLVVLIGATALVARLVRPSTASAALRPTGIPTLVSTADANMMGLSPVPPKPAPGFTLTDQVHRTLALSQFRGRAVVLEFMDPHCTDICPLVSQEFVDAYHDLGSSASKVVFAAVNVNRYDNGVGAMLTYSEDHQLVTIPDWHFFTGPVPTLKSVWGAYGVQVDAPSPTADVIHTSIVYFIDPSGVERFVASPMVDRTASGASYLPAGQITAWGTGIAQAARSLTR